jgi:hypothetical protein
LVFVFVTACSQKDDLGLPVIPDESEDSIAAQGSINQPEAIPATNTPVQMAPTFTPIPTVTLSGSAITNSEQNVKLTNKGDFGTNRNPLTGELVDDPSILQRRPIAVKISNAPARYVRPQSGLSQADLVFEHITEGPITRFTAILYGKTPPNMGPIRSARLIDLEIPPMYDAALAYSGSSIGVSRKLFGSDFSSRILRPSEPAYYRTGENKPYEHTFYAHPAEFWPSLEQRGENLSPAFATFMAFSSVPSASGAPASAANIRYRDWTSIDWQYDPSIARYRRWVDEVEHVDANSGEQLSVSNVILLFAPHSVDTTICEFQSDDGCLAFSTLVHIWGEGRAIILRDGLQFEATWKRPNRGDMLTFSDPIGNPVPLQIGNSWIQVIPIDYPDPVRIDP